MSAHELEDPVLTGKFAFDTTTKTLGRGTDVDSCTTLAGQLDERLDAALAHVKKEGVPIACRAGCSFCCHLRVEVVPHEAIALYRYLKTQIPVEQAHTIAQKVLANAAKVGAMTEAQRWSANTPCAFLVDGHCSAYKARPLMCAGHHSLSRDECEYSYNHPEDLSDGIPMVELLKIVQGAAQYGIEEALDGLGLSDQKLELHTAVAALLRDPGLIDRWRNGRSLLKTANQ